MSPEPSEPTLSRDLSGHPGVRSVMDTLALHHVTPEVRHLPLAVRTAKAAAEALGVTPAEIANSLVFVSTSHDGDVQPLLVLASGGHRVDTDKVAALAGLASIEQADPAFVREHTGFAIGGVAPVGHPAAPAHHHRRHPRALRHGLGRRRAQPLGVRDDLRRADPDHRRPADGRRLTAAPCRRRRRHAPRPASGRRCRHRR